MNPEPLSQTPSQADPRLCHLHPIDIGPQHVRWLWPGRLPLGKLTLLEGSPGSGTSLFALHLAACLSSGSPWPDGTSCPQSNVLLITPHDNFRDTTIHRLDAAGADETHLFCLSEVLNDHNEPSTVNRTHPFSLPQDVAILESVITQMDIRLLILDPFSAIPGFQHSLLDLASLAQRTSCAILLTCTLRQAPSDPLHAHGPTSAVRTAARSCLLLAPDPAHEHRHFLLTTKHSLCAPAPILSYEIAVTDHNMPFLHWSGPRDLTHLTRLSTGPLRSPHRQAILRFLRQSSTACSIKDLIQATSYDYEAGRKMVVRMRMAGELVSPARGLYTTPDHPCLTASSSPQSDPISSAVPTVPNSASHPTSTPQAASTPPADPTDPTVSTVPTDPNPASPAGTLQPDSPSPAVPTAQSPTLPFIKSQPAPGC